MKKAKRYDKGKTQWSLIDYNSLVSLAKVMEFGSNKYGVDNWKNGFERNKLIDCAMRHLISAINGEENDKESGLSHYGHTMANLMFLEYFRLKMKKK